MNALRRAIGLGGWSAGGPAGGFSPRRRAGGGPAGEPPASLSLLRRAIGATLDRPGLTIAVFVSVTLAAASLIPRLRLVTDGRALLPSDHPAIVGQKQLDRTYGSTDLVVIGIDGPVSAPQTLNRVRQISRRLDDVWSLSTVVYPRTVDGALAVTPLIDEQPAEVRRLAMSDPLFRGRLVARDGSATAIYARIAPGADRDAALAGITRIVEHERLLGPVVAEAGLGARILRDLAVLMPLSLLAVALLLWFFFRSIGMVLIGLGEGLSTIVASFALMAALDYPISLVTVVMPVILGTYCVADTVHVGHRYAEKLRAGLSRRAAMDSTLDEIVRPVIYTSLTTAGGFLSFVFTPIPPLRHFGAFTAFGVVAALAVSLFVVPAALTLCSFETRRSHPQPLLLRTTELAHRHPLAVTIAFAVASIAVCAGALRLDVQDRWIDNFDRGSELARADAWFNDRFFGSNVLNVVIDGPANDPGVLSAIAALQGDLRRYAEVGGSVAWGDQLRSVGRGIAGEDRLPRDEIEASQWALLLESAAGRGAVEPYVDPSGGKTNLWLFLNRADYQRTNRVEQAVRASAAARGLRIASIGGDAHIGSVLIGAITRGQQISIAASLLFVLVLVALMLRSASGALLAVLPVLVSVAANFGFMGWSGIPLGVATSTFTSIALGVGVDLAIHWLACVRLAEGEGLGWADSLRRAARDSGRGIVANTVVVGIGFAVLLASAVPPVRYLGLLMALNLAVCCLATLVLLPAAATLLRSAAGSRLVLRRALAAALLLLFAVPAARAADPSGIDIMRRVNARDAGADARMTLRLVLTDTRRGAHEREIELTRRRTPSGYRTRFTVTAPKHVEGIVLLLLEDRPKAQLWMYFPAGDHLTQVVTRGLSALASDFSCEDLRVSFPLDDYDFVNLGRDVIDGQSCWRVEMRPRTENLRRELGFSRAVGWVREDAALIVRADFFDEQGRAFKAFRAEPPERISGVWTLRRYSMINDRARHRSDVIVTGIDYRAGVPAESLAAERLKKGADAR